MDAEDEQREGAMKEYISLLIYNLIYPYFDFDTEKGLIDLHNHCKLQDESVADDLFVMVLSKIYLRRSSEGLDNLLSEMFKTIQQCQLSNLGLD